MTKRAVGMLPVLALFWVSVVSRAQPPETPVTECKLIVSAFDQKGNPLRDLKKENFQVRVAGKRVEVLDAQYSVAPRRVVVLLDMSGSMAGPDATAQWQIARAAVEELLARMPADTPIALLTFSAQVRDRFDFQKGRAAIANWLKAQPERAPIGMKAGRTALFDAIAEGLRLLQPYQTGDAIYAITDGGDNASTERPAQVRTALLTSGVRLFAFLFDQSVPAEVLQREGAGEFLDMIGDTGGVYFHAGGRRWSSPGIPSWQVEYRNDSTNQGLAETSARAMRALVPAFWKLSIPFPEANRREAHVDLQIVDGTGAPRKNVRLIYPKLLLRSGKQ
jgi:hypothetical protein